MLQTGKLRGKVYI